LKSVDRGFYDVEILEYSFASDKLLKVIRKNADFGKQMLILYCTVLLELINRNILDEFMIENLGIIGKNIIISNDIAISNESMLYIFMSMNRMRSKIEGKSDSIIIDKYNILTKQAKNLEKLIDSNKQKISKIYDKLSLIIPIITQTEIMDSESINWPKLD